MLFCFLKIRRGATAAAVNWGGVGLLRSMGGVGGQVSIHIVHT